MKESEVQINVMSVFELRDLLAMAAIQAALQNQQNYFVDSREMAAAAETAYDWADVMLRARTGKKGE